MEWYTFEDKLPQKNEPILICISPRVNPMRRKISSLNPVYKCIFKNEHTGSIILHNLILISGKAVMDKKSIWYCTYWDKNVHWARLE